MVYYQNVTGLRTKLHELTAALAVRACSADVVIFTETWLDSSIASSELAFTGYTVYRCDRSAQTSAASRGGGVLVAVNEKFVSWNIETAVDTLEQLFVHVSVGGTSYVVAAFYAPPASPLEDYQAHCMSVLAIAETYPASKFVIVGDFNLPHTTWKVDPLASILTVSEGASRNESSAACVIASDFSSLDLSQFNSI